MSPETGPQADAPAQSAAVSRRVPALSYFFPAHDEAQNIEALVAEALQELPKLAETFEIIAVDDGSRDETGALADKLAAANPGVVRAVHHEVNQGYGAALRTGFGVSRYPLVCFTDGDRQFKVADLARLLERMAQPTRRAEDVTPDVVVGFRIKRADPLIRTAYARTYRACLRLFFGLGVKDVDCACKLFHRDALEGIYLDSGGAFLSAELLIKLTVSGRRIVEVGIPHYPRTAGSATGAKPAVVFRAVRDFWALRLRLWRKRDEAIKRGSPVLRTDVPTS